jgi:hypothetical protein
LTFCVAAIVCILCSLFSSLTITIPSTVVTLLRRVLDWVHLFGFYLLGGGHASCIGTPKMWRHLRREFYIRCNIAISSVNNTPQTSQDLHSCFVFSCPLFQFFPETGYRQSGLLIPLVLARRFRNSALKLFNTTYFHILSNSAFPICLSFSAV